MRYPYQNPELPVEERVQDLLSRMTLEEKFQQMRLIAMSKERAHAETLDTAFLEANAHRRGAFYNPNSMSVERLNEIQKWNLEHSRLGIPMAFHGECLHGSMNANGTVFPQSVGLGATFNRELMEEVVTCIGREAHANGVNLAYAPNLDLSRDPRWGRVEENYGEDPYLTSQLGTVYVKTLQAQGVAACPKHFIAHGSPESGINLAPVHAGEREFRETMMIPFRDAIREGGAMAVMPAYSEWDGEAVHASHRLLTGLLREEFGFTGQVVSDFGAVKMLHKFQRVAPTALDAGRMALRAGVDMEAPNMFGVCPELEKQVEDGTFPMEYVDRAVSAILRHKFAMGLFENPYVDETEKAGNRSPEALALARRAAQESMVLLKNEGVLPLSPTVGKVALIGPNADNPQLGGYTAREAMDHTVTALQALRERLGEDRVLFARGCSIAGGSDEMLEEAVRAAKEADVAVLVLGDNSNFFGGIGWGDAEDDGTVAVTCGEGFDTHTLDLPGRQQALLEAVWRTGTPVVLVLETGRPYAICWAKEQIPAILQAWYPGEQGGYALMDVLFGDCDPSGRLPISFPRSVGHLPVFYNHKVSARGYYKVPGSPEKPGRDYVFSTPGALYPFGWGLSYTTFRYSELSVPETAKTGEPVTVHVTVENTGSRPGTEVVQLYLTDDYCRIAPFVRQLRGFQKITLAPGESRRVEFTLGFEDFSFVNEDMVREVEPGSFTIAVGTETAAVILK